MTELQQLQQSFFGYLLGKPSDVVQQIQSTVETSAQQRLDIYAVGYRLRLKEAIMTDFEQLHAYIGDDTFEQLMDTYIDAFPSHHPSLRYYSKHLLTLLAQQSPYSELPVLREIAEIEQAFNNSFDASNCETMELAQLAELVADDWPVMRLQFHASVQLLPANFNSFSIWKALSEENEPPALTEESQAWVVWRKGLISRYRALSEPEAEALMSMQAGGDFAALCETLLAHFDEQDTPQQAVAYLQIWIQEKMVCGFAE